MYGAINLIMAGFLLGYCLGNNNWGIFLFASILNFIAGMLLEFMEVENEY